MRKLHTSVALGRGHVGVYEPRHHPGIGGSEALWPARGILMLVRHIARLARALVIALATLLAATWP
jgi:hypothetical protein